ncbi:MAG: 16S rRNA (uracil(1498)-N(3))-methyltransferase [Thermodesulfovibrionales bacterium]|nr:16S rRNA (uracil(1498)-N(3))-methyltransferase [Thermodesulfovibrionales bacterium]
MPRIFIPITSIKEGQISITGEKARYLSSVLRCKKGDELIVFDGRGNCLRTKILRSDRREVIVETLEKFTCDTESPIDIFLAQGLLKGEKMDMVIQKVTELGVKEIIPVITERSQLRETKKVARWRKITGESSRQSGRSIIPLVHEPMYFSDCLSLLATRHASLSLKGLIFYEEGGIKISEAIQKITIHDTGYTIQDKYIMHHVSCILNPASLPIYLLIGPEGGFTREEVTIAEEKGFIVTSLGKRILRAETAAISAITLVQFLLGDLG